MRKHGIWQRVLAPRRKRRLRAVPFRAEALEDRRMLADDHIAFWSASGYTALQSYFASIMQPIPNGAGIAVAQVEADNGAPNPAAFPTQNFINVTAGSTITNHATNTVGLNLYGAWGVAAGIPTVYTYGADQMLGDDLLRSLTWQTPGAPLGRIQNNSWIGTEYSATLLPSTIDALRRLDYIIDQNGSLVVAGSGNVTSAIPSLLDNSFNSIVVGSSYVTTNLGPTHGDAETPGRGKPDIVAYADSGSKATARTSSAAALLLQAAINAGSVDAQRPEVLKAILMAGATRGDNDFGAAPAHHWYQPSSSQPLDPQFGAGNLNIYNSYFILDGGDQDPAVPADGTGTTATMVANRGWDLNSISAATPVGQSYFFELTSPQSLAAVLTWNRRVGITPGTPGSATQDEVDATVTPYTANLDLKLYAAVDSGGGVLIPVGSPIKISNSTIDNVELITSQRLAAGKYVLVVSHDVTNDDLGPTKQYSSWQYALAWDTQAPIGDANLIVTSTADTLTPGTLRYAISQAASATVPLRITFDLAAGSVIALTSPITLTKSLAIDGGTTGALGVTIDGSALSSGQFGLTFGGTSQRYVMNNVALRNFSGSATRALSGNTLDLHGVSIWNTASNVPANFFTGSTTVTPRFKNSDSTTIIGKVNLPISNQGARVVVDLWGYPAAATSPPTYLGYASTIIDPKGMATYKFDNVGSFDHYVATATINGLQTSAYTVATATSITVAPVLASFNASPYSATEGTAFNLTASATDADADESITYSLGPGAPVGAQINSTTGVLTWTPIDSTSSPLTVTVIATDNGPLRLTSSKSFTVNVANVAPSVPTLGGASTGVVTAAYLLPMSVTDPSVVDTLADFTYHVNWGDGSPIEDVVGPANTQATHTYSTVGPHSISVTATDKDGATGAAATSSVTISAVSLLPNQQNGSLTDLVWTGSAGVDQVQFQQLSATTIRVTTLMENGVAINYVETFNGITGRVIARGMAGNDSLSAALLTTTQATLDGGANNNTLQGGAAGDILIGGSNGSEGRQGNNVIIAGNGDNVIYGNAIAGLKGSTGGNNVIVGGSGSDVIYGAFGTVPNDGGEGGQNLIIGGGGPDTIYASQQADGAEGGKGSILVSGTTNLSQAALQSILAEWTSTRTYATRIANISGTGTGTRNNGNDFLQAGVTVANDASIDLLFGDTMGKQNWLLETLAQDVASRVKGTETVTNLP